MNKKATTPAAKPATTAPAAKTDKPAAPATVPVAAPATSEATTTPVVATQPKAIDLNKPEIKEAIANGLKLIKEGKSKADAAMTIFEAMKGEDKEVIIAAFVQGATLTDKGAVTYFYNCTRKSKKLAAAAKTA